MRALREFRRRRSSQSEQNGGDAQLLCSLVPTVGGEAIITGAALAGLKVTSDAAVQLRGVPCSAVSVVRAGMVRCSMPPGIGAGVPAELRSSALDAPLEFEVCYLPPTVSSLSLAAVPTRGGAIDIHGDNFGDKQALVEARLTHATGICVPCPSLRIARPHAQLSVDIPAGVGAGWNLELSVAHQSCAVSLAYAGATGRTLS